MEQTPNQSGLISAIALLDYVWDKAYAHKYFSLQYNDINVLHAPRLERARREC